MTVNYIENNLSSLGLYLVCIMRYYQTLMIMNLLTVPQVLAMMVDLEEEPDWSMQDEPEEEDTDRYDHYLIFTQYCKFLNKCEELIST